MVYATPDRLTFLLGAVGGSQWPPPTFSQRRAEFSVFEQSTAASTVVSQLAATPPPE